MNSMGARELKLRVVNALVQKGATFDSEKIQELLEKQQAEEQAALVSGCSKKLMLSGQVTGDKTWPV